MKILSFIVPSYNSAKFLDKCIPSFLNEAVLDKLDIIIVNDGSTDETPVVAQKYCDAHPDSIRLINQENKGHGGALNTGCAVAVGKYLKVIDADDWVETQNLPEFVAKLEKSDADVVLTHHYIIDITTGEVKKWKNYPEKFDISYNFEQIMASWKNFERSLTFHGITYNTAFYHKNGIALSEHVFFEDHEFATMPCCHAASIMPMDLFIYDYRIGDVEQSVSNQNQLKRISHTQTVLERFLSEYACLELPENSGGREYFCMKAQGLLLSYLTTAMLVEPDKKKGRLLAAQMMARFRTAMPRAYELAKKQYLAYRAMNRLHISKQTFDQVLHSRIYSKFRRKHDFD